MDSPPHLSSVKRTPTKLGAPEETYEISALTLQMVEGNDMAYHVFHHTYCTRLSRYLLIVTGGNEEAMRDALQETYRRVVKHVRVFTEESVFWSWLTVLARSAVADDRRKRRRYLAFLDQFIRHTAVLAESTAHENDLLGEVMERNLSALAYGERTLIEWKYFEHRPVSEIAARLAMTEKAVESRLGRIRQKLKRATLAQLKNEPSL